MTETSALDHGSRLNAAIAEIVGGTTLFHQFQVNDAQIRARAFRHSGNRLRAGVSDRAGWPRLENA